MELGIICINRMLFRRQIGHADNAMRDQGAAEITPSGSWLDSDRVVDDMQSVVDGMRGDPSSWPITRYRRAVTEGVDRPAPLLQRQPVRYCSSVVADIIVTI